MFSNFFINRPKFAVVLSLIIIMIGAIAFKFLPIERYPTITPPQILVRASYPGADPEVIENAVAIPIEEQINGVEDMIYMESSSLNGNYKLNVYFEVGTDVDMAMVRVQNRLSLATPKLPQEVREQGLIVKESTGGAGVLVIALSSPDNSYDEVYLHNYASIHIKDILSRVNGVGEVNTFGDRDYSMRIWLNPQKMTDLKITAGDVLNAIRSQNIEVPAGEVGGFPVDLDQQFQYIIKTEGRFSEPSQFENIIVRANTDGSFVRIKDIADVELGAKNYKIFSRVDGKNSIAFGINQLANANLIKVVEDVKKELTLIEKRLPEGMQLDVVYDGAEYVDESMYEVFITLFLALFLVTFVIYVFLQDLRATFIPVLAIPVSIIGTFAFLNIFGFTINTFTLFGLVLAIGIVVDDAIVVIENIQRHLSKGKTPKEATVRTMQQVTGAVIATTLVLLAVFVPAALMPGITGKMYQQFAITISIAVSISSLVALTLTPALCAVILKIKTGRSHEIAHWDWFNNSFDSLREKYLKIAEKFIKTPRLTLLILAGLIAGIVIMFMIIPIGFLPKEDQGFIITQVQLPEGASLSRTDEVATKIENIMKKIPEVNRVVVIPGMGGSSNAMVLAQLKPWGERKAKHQSVHAVIGKLQQQFFMIPEARIFAFTPPSIPGLGMFGGFELQLQDRGGNSPQYLAEEAQKIIMAANQNPKLDRVFTSFQANLPQLKINVDREKAYAHGVNIKDIFSELSANFGSAYVNDFNTMGRVFQVRLQADGTYRDEIDDVIEIYVRNNKGQMVSIDRFVDIESVVGPQSINRFNMFRSVPISGSGAMGVSSGEAIETMKAITEKIIPSDASFEWSGVARQEIESSGQAVYVLLLALIFVYLFLVALYESWTLPFGVILIAPVAVVGGMVAQMISGAGLDLYCQVGLIMLIGMSTKHAILIIEFARTQREEYGLNPVDAAITAAKLRFRAILMTVFTFIFSVMPLVIATGAGAEARHSIGKTVFGGMIASAIIGTVLVPAFYVIIETVKENFRNKKSDLTDNSNQEGELSYE